MIEKPRVAGLVEQCFEHPGGLEVTTGVGEALRLHELEARRRGQLERVVRSRRQRPAERVRGHIAVAAFIRGVERVTIAVCGVLRIRRRRRGERRGHAEEQDEPSRVSQQHRGAIECCHMTPPQIMRLFIGSALLLYSARSWGARLRW
ncbi:MAG: hypothetical protein JNL82_28990 [Myxococcales bacterium]|nr:hypothetical protein [Myxococcales bacterium]